MGRHDNDIILNGNEQIFGLYFIVMALNASFGSQNDWKFYVKQ